MRRLAVLVCAVLLLGATPARAALTDDGYWAFADRLMTGIEPRWSEARGLYVADHGEGEVRENAALLLTHAVAALKDHTGPSRHDARARALVDRLTRPPAWLGTAPAPAPTLSTCWSADLETPVRGHMSLEPKVAEALTWAWRARDQLALTPEQRYRIASTVSACASSPAWRWPRRLLDQINWNAEMYASAATVAGRTDLLVSDYRRQLADFARGVAAPMAGMRSPNLGPGYEFHYRPDRGDGAASNLDTPEYANIVAHALAHYDQGLAAGMQPLPAPSVRLLRAWVTRLLAGSWTHAGYLNWDTSRGFRRWHSGQYWAFALQGLQAIAVSPRFWQDPRDGAWAKSIFDHALGLYQRLAKAGDGVFPPPLIFGVDTRMKNATVWRCRMLATVARAIGLGMGSLPASRPPPLYAYDYGTGRLAISTPRYSTAIVPDDRGQMGYGGIDLARLFGPGQRVVSGTGGQPPAAFGLVVSDARGRRVLAGQRPRRGNTLRVLRSPRGRLARPRPYPRHPYAGPFAVVRARTTAARRTLHISSDYRFGRAAVDARWRVACRRRCPPDTVRAHFPTWRRITAVLRDGSRVRLGTGTPRRRLRVAAVARVNLGGYRLVRLRGPRGATLFAVPTRAEATNPSPRPSLAIQLGAGRRFHRLALSGRLVPTG